MSYTKVTMLFSQSSVKNTDDARALVRHYGWSESWYIIGSGPSNEVKATSRELARKRAQLLGDTASVIGIRIQQVSPLGPMQIIKESFPGVINTKVDSPQQSLLFYLTAPGKANRRQTIVRGVPDSRIEGGEYRRLPAYDRRLREYFDYLTEKFLFKGASLDAASVKIHDITSGGIVTTDVAHGRANADAVQVFKTKAAGNRLKGVKTRVNGVPASATTLQLRDWPHGASVGGRLRLIPEQEYFSPVLEEGLEVLGSVVSRDTGKPFNLSRGRRSARSA